MKTNISKILTVIIAVALLGGGFLVVNSKDDKSTTNTSTANTSTKVVKFSADKKTVSYDGQEGKTAMDLLNTLATVETEASAYGDFVTTINGLKADSTKEYWSFYVNGAYASEGAGTYITSDTDKIEWKLESL